MRSNIWMTLITAAVLGSQSLAGEPVDPPNTPQYCLTQKATQENFSGVISVFKHDRQAALVIRGRLSDRDSSTIADKTRFNLASASKVFTAVAVAQLVDAGTVQLDSPVGSYVHGLTPQTSAVTVRQLLTHSSGLGDFFRPQNMQTLLKARTASDLLPLIVSEQPTFVPGSHFQYSNSGFALLGILIERVSGMTYAQYLQKHIFELAGMKDSGLEATSTDTALAMTIGLAALTGVGSAVQHRELTSADGKPISTNSAPSEPRSATLNESNGAVPSPKPLLKPAPGAKAYGTSAGGVFSSTEDLQRFARALTSNRLASPSMTAALTHKQIVAVPADDSHPERDYGFGFMTGTYDGHRWFGHNGGTLGANSEFIVFPDDDITLVVLSNRDPPAATNLLSYARGLVLRSVTQASCSQDSDARL